MDESIEKKYIVLIKRMILNKYVYFKLNQLYNYYFNLIFFFNYINLNF
jgi:hypothetical protein